MPKLAKVYATVQVRSLSCHVGPNLECLPYSPLPIVLLTSHNFSLIPIYAVVIFVDLDPNTTVVVISSWGGGGKEGGRREERDNGGERKEVGVQCTVT